MKQLLLFLMVLATIPNALFSQAFENEQHPLQRLAFSAEVPTKHTTFEESGLNTDMPEIKDLVDRLSKRLEQLGYPGMAFTMVTPESVLWSGGMGHADLETRRKVDTQTQFRLGSLTKGVIALGILKLVEEGKFDLESELRDLAPEVPFENRFSATHPVRVHHLLEHTTGFEEMRLNALYNLKEDPDLPLLKRIHRSKASLKSRWEPGTKHSYCNPGYLVAGYLIEKYGEMPYDEYLQKYILHPSGMKYSGFQNRISAEDNIATGYNLRDRKWIGAAYYPLYSSPSGALNTGAHDLAKYLQLLLNKGKVNDQQVVKKEHIERMEQPGETDAVRCGLNNGYGLGIYQHYGIAPFPLMAHGGAMEGFSSHIAYNREYGFGYAISVNARVDLRPIVQIVVAYIQQHYIQNLPPIQPLDPMIPEKYTGYYEYKTNPVELLEFQEKLNGGVYIFEDHGRMNVKRIANRQSPIFAVKGNTFRYPEECGPTSVFCEDKNGTPVFMDDGGLAYYEKTSDTSSSYIRTAFNSSILFLITLIPVGAIWLIMLLIGKIHREELMTRFSPVIGFVLLISCQLLLNHILEDIMYAGILTVYTGGFYLATLGVALFSLASMGLVIRDFRSFRNMLVPIYLSICSIALGFITAFFWYYGLIGIRFWDY